VQVGAITGYVDLAQILLYAFWLFFAGLIWYLVRENHREGYPMETEGAGRAPEGWPVPGPKTYLLADGGTVVVPDPAKAEPAVSAVRTAMPPGSPIEPTGDPLVAGVGAGAWANRANVPDMTFDGHPKIRPLRALEGYGVAPQDVDPRGLPVLGADGVRAGTVRDLWLDSAELLHRYLEVDLGSRVVLLPIPFARIRRDRVEVAALLGHQFAGVPGLASSDVVTMLEEERVTAYYGAGTLYATPARSEPWL
jgi:photosynthetic reaction center H subunit